MKISNYLDSIKKGYVLWVITLICTGNILAQSTASSENTNESSSDTRFVGVDYRVIIPETISSEYYNLDGFNIMSTEFNIDLSYPWFLDKKPENSILLGKLSYTKVATSHEIAELELSRIKAEVPVYLYDIPDFHKIGLSFFLNQNFRNNWDLTAGYDIVFLSDFNNQVDKSNFNSTALIYLQKGLGKFSIGGGGVFYIINNELAFLPLISFGYTNDKFDIQLNPPLSLDVNYHLNMKSTLSINANLIIEGFKLDDTNSLSSSIIQPNYIDYSGFDYSIGYDRKFYETLHYKISVGAVTSELTYLDNITTIDNLTIPSGLLLKLSLYTTF